MPVSEKLLDTELFWAENYTYLLGKGFLLRPRYSPEWKPSWILPDGSKRPEPVEIFEDAHVADVRLRAFFVCSTNVHIYLTDYSSLHYRRYPCLGQCSSCTAKGEHG